MVRACRKGKGMSQIRSLQVRNDGANRIRQSASWYRLSASNPEYISRRFASPCLAWPGEKGLSTLCNRMGREYRITEDVGGVVRIKQADDVEAKVALEPDDIGVRAVEDLETSGC